MASRDHALSVLRKQLSTNQWQQGERIPTVDSLSQLCGTSKGTVCRALAILRKDGLIHGGRGAGIFAGPKGVSALPESEESQLWMRVKVRLGREICFGTFATDARMRPGKLALEYGVSFRTMRKALISLKNDGVIVESGRTFLPSRLPDLRHNPTIAFISGGTSLGGITTSDHRTESLLECFERESRRLGMRSLCEGFDPRTPSGLLEAIAILKSASHLSGAIVNMWNPWTPDLRRRWLDLIDYLVGLAIPVVIIDQDGSLEFPSSYLRNNRVRILRIPGKRAGELVADMLVQQGHRAIAYVSSYFSFEWARSRYAGLRDYCRRYGRAAVTTELFAAHEIISQNELTLAFLGLGEDNIRALYGERLSKIELSDLIDQLHRIESLELSNTFAKVPLRKTILPLSTMLVSLAQSDHDTAIFDQMLSFLQHIASMNAFDQYLRPFLLESIRKSSATAWVCSDEATAISAKSAILAAGRAVPGDISVVGFDNWRGAHEHQLSAYDFNMNGFAQEALLMILDKRVFKDRPGISEVDGYVVERKTTRSRLNR